MSYFHKFFLKCLSHLGSQYILNSTVQEALSKSHCLLAPPLSHPIQALQVCQQSRAWLSVRSPRLGSIITKPENQTPLEFHQQERLGRFLALTPNLSSFYCCKQQRILNMWDALACLWSSAPDSFGSCGQILLQYMFYILISWHLWAQPCLHLDTTKFFTKSHLQ